MAMDRRQRKGSDYQQIAVRLDRGLVRWLDRQAKRLHISRAAYVAQLVEFARNADKAMGDDSFLFGDLREAVQDSVSEAFRQINGPPIGRRG